MSLFEHSQSLALREDQVVCVVDGHEQRSGRGINTIRDGDLLESVWFMVLGVWPSSCSREWDEEAVILSLYFCSRPTMSMSFPMLL